MKIEIVPMPFAASSMLFGFRYLKGVMKRNSLPSDFTILYGDAGK